MSEEITSKRGGFRAAPGGVVAAVISAALVSGCGGGGDGNDKPEALGGGWTMQVEGPNGTSASPAKVAGAAILPSASSTSPELRAGLISGLFAAEMKEVGATVSQKDGNVKATGPGTDYNIVIDEFTVSNYTRCDPCNVGSAVSFTVNTKLSEEGVLVGYPNPLRTYSETYKVLYTRTE